MILSKYEILQRDCYTCQICGKFNINPQLAHRIKNDKTKKGKGSIAHIINFIWYEYKEWITKTEAKKILSDERNLVTTCSLKCNDKCNLFFKPLERDHLIKEIYEKEFLSANKR